MNQISSENQKNSEEILELAEKQAGAQAMQMLMDQHLGNLMRLRENFSINDGDLISTYMVSKRSGPEQVRDQIKKLHDVMRAIITEVATRIENEKYASAEQSIENLRLGRVQREKVSALVTADKSMHISCQSLKVAVEIFAELNKQIIQRLDFQNLQPGEERNLVLGNAILVYELTQFSINFIESFGLRGLDRINSIYREMQQTMRDLRRELDGLRKQASSPDIPASLRDQVLESISYRESSVAMLEQEWADYMRSISSLSHEVGTVASKLPSLRLIRDNASSQINTLVAVSVLQIVKSNMKAIEQTVLQLEKLELASLSPDRVRRLLQI